MADFVLLHGTTQDATGWDLVCAALERKGHMTHRVTLTGNGPSSSAEYVAEITSQIAPSEAPVVVAHSGSGLLLPDLARALSASVQVWLAALIPAPAPATFLDEVTAAPTEMFAPDWLGRDPTTDTEAAEHFLFHDCPAERLPWALSTLHRFVPADVYQQQISLARDIPSVYLACSRDRTLLPQWARRAAMERLQVEPIVLDAGHCPHVSMPEAVASLLIDASTP